MVTFGQDIFLINISLVNFIKSWSTFWSRYIYKKHRLGQLGRVFTFFIISISYTFTFYLLKKLLILTNCMLLLDIS